MMLESIHNFLYASGISLILIERIDSLLKAESINSSVCSRTTQGGVLSSLFWLLVFNKILVSFDQLRMKVVAYADDVVVLISGKFLTTISDLMQSALV